MELKEVRAVGPADESSQPLEALDRAVGGLVEEEADAQEAGLALDEDEAGPAAVMAAFKHARPVHVPAFPDPEAVCDSLAVPVFAVPERACATAAKRVLSSRVS